MQINIKIFKVHYDGACKNCSLLQNYDENETKNNKIRFYFFSFIFEITMYEIVCQFVRTIVFNWACGSTFQLSAKIKKVIMK